MDFDSMTTMFLVEVRHHIYLDSSLNFFQVEDEDVFIPPDGGYGWFVALGAFIAFFFSAGIVKSYGVIFDSILLEYKDATVSQAAWIPVC